MSKYIEGCEISNSPIFEPKNPKKFLAAKFRNVLKSTHIHPCSLNVTAEEKYIGRLCRKLSDRQYTRLRLSNEREMERHMAKLKDHLKKDVRVNAISVEKFFRPEPERKPLDIKKLSKGLPKRVWLEQKYSNKVANCRQILQETRKIVNFRDNYQGWLDKTKNSPVKSPNYTRMNFVLSKLSENPQAHHQFQSVFSKSSTTLFKGKQLKDYEPKTKQLKTKEGTINCSQVLR